MKTQTRLLVLSAVIFLTRPAHAFKISLVGALQGSSQQVTGLSNPYQPGVINPPPDATARITLGGGGLLAIEANSALSFELGALYTPRQVGSDIVGSWYLPQVQFPLMLRFTLLPIVSIGAGGYYSIGVGTNYDFHDTQRNQFGLVFSVAFDIPIFPGIGLLIDGRYLHGLANANRGFLNSTFFYYPRDVQVLAGLTLSL